MQGKQLALSFVSPFKSIMQSSQVSCSTNLHHLMAGERNEVGKAPESSPGGLFCSSHFCSDSIVKMLLFEFPFLNIFLLPFFSYLKKLIKKKKDKQNSSLYHHFFFLEVCKRFLTKCQACLSGIFFFTGLKEQTQIPVHPTIVTSSPLCCGQYSYSTLCQL